MQILLWGTVHKIFVKTVTACWDSVMSLTWLLQAKEEELQTAKQALQANEKELQSKKKKVAMLEVKIHRPSLPQAFTSS